MAKRRLNKHEGSRRVASFILRGKELLDAGQQEKSMQMVADGLDYYSNAVLSALSPYAAADAPLLILSLTHIAKELERTNEGAKELAEGFDRCIKKPDLKLFQKTERPNTYIHSVGNGGSKRT